MLCAGFGDEESVSPGMWVPLEAGKAQKRILPCSLQQEAALLAHTLTLDF